MTRNPRNTILFSFFLLLCSCSSLVKTVTGPLDPSRLFPDGKYQHHVILIQNDGTETEFEGVLKITREDTILVGLSNFGSTVFQVNDIKKAKLEVKIFYEPMQKYEEQFKDFYLSMKQVLVKRNNDLEIKMIEGASIAFGQKDKNGIPESFEINHPKFKVKVKVARYEL